MHKRQEEVRELLMLEALKKKKLKSIVESGFSNKGGGGDGMKLNG